MHSFHLIVVYHASPTQTTKIFFKKTKKSIDKQICLLYYVIKINKTVCQANKNVLGGFFKMTTVKKIIDYIFVAVSVYFIILVLCAG